MKLGGLSEPAAPAKTVFTLCGGRGGASPLVKENCSKVAQLGSAAGGNVAACKRGAAGVPIVGKGGTVGMESCTVVGCATKGFAACP